jgi:hypothetical protein
VSAVGGGLLRVTLPASTSVAELKRLLEQQAGIAALRQRLVFAGRLLPDGEAVGQEIGFCGASGERVVLLLDAPPDGPGSDPGSDDWGLAAAAPVDPPCSRPAPHPLLSTQNRFASLALADADA